MRVADGATSLLQLLGLCAKLCQDGQCVAAALGDQRIGKKVAVSNDDAQRQLVCHLDLLQLSID